MAETKKRSARADRKSDWKSRNDRGPHKAVLPSGMEVSFVIPNETQLIRAELLPERLMEIAVVTSAYPGGADGYMEAVAVGAVNAPPEQRDVAQANLKTTVQQGLELRDWLVAEMLVDPKVTVEEVAAGDFPDLDIEMLIEFAERRRNTDARGNRLPIAVLEEYARFRDDTDGDSDREPGGSDRPDDPGIDAGPDSGDV